MIYDFDHEHPDSDGARPLYGAQYFARFTQRLISALTVQTNYGVLYEVDMRLRPSGRAGPVATQIDGFSSYQEREAWTWEHMALTRARVVSGSPDFRARDRSRDPRRADAASASRAPSPPTSSRCARAIAHGKGRRRSLGPQICRRRAGRYRVHRAISAARPRRGDCRKFSTPRPRACWTRPRASACSRSEDAEVLRPAVRLFHDLAQILRLCLTGPFDPKAAGPGVLALLARAADLPDFPALEAHVKETQQKVRECFVRILGGAP